mmetsp:Transcript_47158/g.87864  ORF Transcript_47158/g.87864 Transcript_47158/m.87864 type:complete len:124 (+) Transcript_47158:1725-2096(+)
MQRAETKTKPWAPFTAVGGHVTCTSAFKEWTIWLQQCESSAPSSVSASIRHGNTGTWHCRCESLQSSWSGARACGLSTPALVPGESIAATLPLLLRVNAWLRDAPPCAELFIYCYTLCTFDVG